MQDSLGGNTRTTVIATLGPMSEHKDESLSTLLFADRASRVVTRVRRNEVVDDAVLLSRAQVRSPAADTLVLHVVLGVSPESLPWLLWCSSARDFPLARLTEQ